MDFNDTRGFGMVVVLMNLLFSVAFSSVVFFESFDEPWEGHWIPSNKKDYEGNWKHGKNNAYDDYGLLVSEKARKYGIVVEIPKVDFNNDPVVLQYDLKTQNGLECGGAYLKFLMPQNAGWDPKHFDDESPYSIMFGPDKCGATNKVHFIFRHKHPKTDEYVEHHLKYSPVSTADKVTHIYTAIIYPNSTVRILIDGEEKKTAHFLSDDFDPPVLPPKTIPDPDDKKPEDWDERAKFPDPEAKKPDHWDAEAPMEIEDLESEKAEGWLDDEPVEIDDLEAMKPDDWDDEEDGEWEAPKISNPKCEVALGCGKWKRPLKRNPNYKGKWYPPMIDNPNYKGIWKPRQIPNPDYFELDRPNLEAIAAIGIEIWTVQDGMLFDNILIADDVSDAKEYQDKYWKPKFEVEKDKEKTEEEAGAHILGSLEKPIFKVAKYPYGVDEKVKDFENTVLLQLQQSGKPGLVGIVGLGGIGKTTLAKELFNRKSSGYSKSCFLSIARENRDENSLIFLQKKLFQSLTGSDLGSGNIDEAIERLKKHTDFQALIILDNVDNRNQVDAVLAFQTVLSSDSLILITSRDRGVLTRSRVQNSSIYKLSGLNTQHSLELFCSHAFDRPSPLPGFESLVDKYVKACDGLPLSLEVLGALLRGENDKDSWKTHLDRIQQIVPSEIQKILKISYDGLDPDEKEIFLDIANFFIGEKKEMAIRIWDGSGWKGSLAFQNLQKKSLVEVDSENKIKMHDHLRDMGRTEASGLPRRVWRWTENIDDLLEKFYDEQVRGIRTARDHELRYKRSPNKQHIRELQLLDVEDGELVPILGSLRSPKLIWLRWRNCSDSSLPSRVPKENLRVLEVNSSVLKRLWRGTSQAPLQLRELIITSPLSKLPKSIGQLKHLELIILRCPSGNLKTLPNELCHLQSLKSFELTNCSEIKSLPNSFGYLTNLKHIDLSGCKKLERLPDSFGYLAKLEHIDLSGSQKLERLPDSFGCLRSLKRFKLTKCSEMKSLPDSVGYLTNLEHIHLSCSKNLVGLPDSFGHLLSLKRFELTDCSEIKSLPDSLGCLANLEHIDLSRSENLQNLPNSFGDLTRLKYLDLSRCNNLTISSKTLGNINTLEYINLSYCKKIEVLPLQVAHQRSLQKLYCPFLEMVPSPLCGNLKELKLRNGNNCEQFKCLPICTELLTQLTKLTVNECVFLEKVEGETEISRLRESRGERTLSSLASFIDMSKLLQVRHLELYKTEISEVSFAEGFCPNLQHLLIKSCNHLVKVGTLPNALIKLELTSCFKLKKIEGLCGLAKLQMLNIKWCRELEELSSIETLVSLEVMDVNKCTKLKRIHRLAQLTKLRRLDIVECSELEELPGVEHLTSLKWLDASGSSKLRWGEGVVEQLGQRQLAYLSV